MIFAAGEAGIAAGAADHEATGRVDEVLGVLSSRCLGSVFWTTSSMIASLSVLCFTLSECWVETTTVSMRFGTSFSYSTVTWLLPSGRRKSTWFFLAHGRQLLGQLVSVHDRRRHQLGRLVAGVAEHQALIAGALLLEQALTLGDALRDVGRLRLDRDQDAAGVGVEAHVAAGVAKSRGWRCAPPCPKSMVALVGDFTGQHDEARLAQRLAGDAAHLVAGQRCVEHGVGDGVAHLVWMAFVTDSEVNR